MRFCTHCGHEVEDGAQFCSNCGMPVDEQKPIPEPAPQASSQEKVMSEQVMQPQQVRPDSSFVPYQQTVQMTPISAKCRTFGIISFVLGICSIVFCWFGIFPIVGIFLGLFPIACGILGLIFSGVSRREGSFKLAKLGKIFSIIGLSLSGVLWIIGLIITLTGNYYYY